MEDIHVLVSARVTVEQLERMRGVHPRLVIDGEPGGVALQPLSDNDDDLEDPQLPPPRDIARLLERAEVLLVSRIPPNLAVRAPRLRWIQVTSAGVDHLWQPFLDASEIIVTSASGVHAIPMAEFVVSCLLAFAKGWLRLLRQQREHRWQKLTVDELHGKTLVLLGLGAIGGAVSRQAKSLGMYIVGMRRQGGRGGIPLEVDEVIPVAALSSTLRRADYVVATLPLTPRTRGLIGADAFGSMKPSAVFVNVGRGGTVDQPALVSALQEGRIAGAALDVYAQEPLPPDSPLWDLPNVLLTPHCGSVTARYMERVTELFCDNLRRYTEGQPLLNVVDRVEGY